MASKETKIKSYRAKISNAQRVLANFEKFLREFVPKRDFPVIEIRQKETVSEREIFEKCVMELESLEDDPDYENIRTQFDECYYSTYSKAFLLMKPSTASISQNSSQTSLLSQNNSNLENLVIENRIPTHSHRGKLPLLNTPTFSGSYDTWLGFHDLFKSLVDNNNTISEIEKLYYLKGCLKDEAAEILDSIELSAENYSVAWSLLKDRYDNRRIIREGHVKSILKLPCIVKHSRFQP